MFDDDTSYLEETASELRGYGFNVLYPYERCIMAAMSTSTQYTLLFIRKKKNLPFYQLFLMEFVMDAQHYFKLVQDDQIFDYLFDNPDKVLDFDAADLSGHETFRAEVTRALQEKFA